MFRAWQGCRQGGMEVDSSPLQARTPPPRPPEPSLPFRTPILNRGHEGHFATKTASRLARSADSALRPDASVAASRQRTFQRHTVFRPRRRSRRGCWRRWLWPRVPPRPPREDGESRPRDPTWPGDRRSLTPDVPGATRSGSKTGSPAPGAHTAPTPCRLDGVVWDASVRPPSYAGRRRVGDSRVSCRAAACRE
jgi:hypothetical protein